MILSRISELKQAAVWSNFSSGDNLRLLPRTLIYGFNGSGKTTLTRVFSSIERGTLEDRLPAEVTFKIETSDGTTVTHELANNPFGKNLLVFNTDFVARNFQWDASSTKGIAYLSEKKVEARKEFDEIVPQLIAAQESSKKSESAKSTADKDIAKFKTRVARNIRELAPTSTYTQSYDARKIHKHYSESAFDTAKKLSTNDISANQELITQREALPAISFSLELPEGLTDWLKKSRPLLSQSISVIALEEFESHSSFLRWVEEGYRYHESQSLENCLLCGNRFSKDRREQLQAVFDNSWTQAVAALEEAVECGREFQTALRNLYRSVPKLEEIAPDGREAFKTTRESIETAITLLGKRLSELLDGLELRVADPTKTIVTKEELASFDLQEWLANFASINADLSATLTSHNDKSANFTAIQQRAFTNIEWHILATNQSEWNTLQKAASVAETELKKAGDKSNRLAVRQMELRNELQDHGVGAEKMNQLIWAYLGHKELRLVAEGGGYKILRADGEAATELSEGERTAVSFCYFLTQLAAEGRKPESLVLVIDDPISSLDTAARTYAYSLMTRMTKKCAQVIVLTHNTSFMNMIKREFQTLQKRHEGEDFTALLSLDCRSCGDGKVRVTSLTSMPALLVKHDSEYHYLFSLVREAVADKDNANLFLLPNATRKLLEMFATFCSPGEANFAAALGEHHQRVKDDIDVRALERLVQIESHGKIEGLSTLPDLTLEEALRAAEAGMNFIRLVNSDHYKKMRSATNS